jgi:hypothetical protein
MHWNELYMPWAECEWPKIAWKFVQANVALKVKRDLEPLKVFVQESLGEPWRDMAGEKPDVEDLSRLSSDYALGELWQDSKLPVAKILTADVQQGHLIYVMRAYRQDGECRLLDAGKTLDFDSLAEIAAKHGVKPGMVGIDSAHRTAVVLAACAKRGQWRRGPDGEYWDGWMPMLGDDAREFSRSSEGRTIKSYHKLVEVDANIGMGGRPMPVERVSWCGDHYKDMLYRQILRGIISGWTVPRHSERIAGGEYVKQMLSTEWREVRDAEGVVVGGGFHEIGRHDYGDCESMQLVMADLFHIARATR